MVTARSAAAVTQRLARFRKSLKTPVGNLTPVADGTRIVALDWFGDATDDLPVLNEAVHQLQAYFEGALTTFDLPLKLGNTDFQTRFLTALTEIPFGETRTYGDLAEALGVSPQAIGQACGANPIPVIVPCHRVLAANGLGGFSGAGGVEAKVALLKHEGAASLLI